MDSYSQSLFEMLDNTTLVRHVGLVSRKQGLLIESQGPADVGIGEICQISLTKSQEVALAQVVGFKDKRLLLLPYNSIEGLTIGSKVRGKGESFSAKVGDDLLGRVLNAFCHPIDQGDEIKTLERREVKRAAIRPLERRKIDQIMETGIRAIDSMLTIGYGQRLSIMAGSGVGKSTLLGMLVKNSSVDIIVVGLIGERGREVLDFIQNTLGKEGLKKAIVIVATADEPALLREGAVLTSVTIAEYYRDQGQSVLLIIDSLTRYAMARREIGLSVGEPATSRGYTPSVFSEMAGLLERCGTSRHGGSITGLFTVLVEGDDIHDPIADSVRGIVDGHIVLSRDLANKGHFPAIDILASISRLANELMTQEERELAVTLRDGLNTLSVNKDLIELGVYKTGNNTYLDSLLTIQKQIDAFLKQGTAEKIARKQSILLLKKLLHPLIEQRLTGEK